jgi:hypothetical protein
MPGRVGAAESSVSRSFPVVVLPTTDARSTGTPLTYPAAVERRVPLRQAALLSAYGVAGRIFLAPRGWTGRGVMAANNGVVATLSAGTGSGTPGGRLEYQWEETCWGCAAGDAAQYFPWPRAHWNEIRVAEVPLPQARRLLHKVYLTLRQLAYRAPDTADGLEVDGLVYSSIDGRPDTASTPRYPLFERVEVALPASLHNLATTMLNPFVRSR